MLWVRGLPGIPTSMGCVPGPGRLFAAISSFRGLTTLATIPATLATIPATPGPTIAIIDTNSIETATVGTFSFATIVSVARPVPTATTAIPVTNTGASDTSSTSES
uniref:Uncharacterized protein n=1 Tax=Haptolina ericina TaxID=156174 RepID=A0A7S3BXN3_9EUKA